MMLPGGAAAKLGNRYETWCAVAETVRLLHGETDTLRIEVPGIDKAEFVVAAGTRREAHQAKRSHPAGKWSFAALRADGLLRYVGEHLADNNNRFVFTSGSEARELLELYRPLKPPLPWRNSPARSSAKRNAGNGSVNWLTTGTATTGRQSTACDGLTSGRLTSVSFRTRCAGLSGHSFLMTLTGC